MCVGKTGFHRSECPGRSNAMLLRLGRSSSSRSFRRMVRKLSLDLTLTSTRPHARKPWARSSAQAAKVRGGYAVQVPFTPGRTYASQAQTDVKSFAVLDPSADGFRNFNTTASASVVTRGLVEKADRLYRGDHGSPWRARKRHWTVSPAALVQGHGPGSVRPACARRCRVSRCPGSAML